MSGASGPTASGTPTALEIALARAAGALRAFELAHPSLAADNDDLADASVAIARAQVILRHILHPADEPPAAMVRCPGEGNTGEILPRAMGRDYQRCHSCGQTVDVTGGPRLPIHRVRADLVWPSPVTSLLRST